MGSFPESTMTDALAAWLRGMGYGVWAEMPPGIGGTIDMVGIAEPVVIGIEMKTSLTRMVQQQAMLAQLSCDAVYCAVLSKPKSVGLQFCGKHGVGVLRVADNVVDLVLDACLDGWPPNKYSHDRIIENSHLYPQGGIAGLPVMAGEGPAIETAKAVYVYRQEHPKATWKEIYREVTNHYASVGSMMSSMSKCRMANRDKEWAN